MTHEQFFKELKKFKWETIGVAGRNLIRLKDDEQKCPIVAVFNKKFDMDYSSPLYGRAAKMLELDRAELIAWAADGHKESIWKYTTEQVIEMRAKLEEMCLNGRS